MSDAFFDRPSDPEKRCSFQAVFTIVTSADSDQDAAELASFDRERAALEPNSGRASSIEGEIFAPISKNPMVSCGEEGTKTVATEGILGRIRVVPFGLAARLVTHTDDFKMEPFSQLLLGGIRWTLQK